MSFESFPAAILKVTEVAFCVAFLQWRFAVGVVDGLRIGREATIDLE